MKRRRPARERGASAVELAIIAPALIVLIFFVVQGALWLYGRQVALQAAREGVSQLRLYPSTPTGGQVDQVKANVVTYASNIGRGALEKPVSDADYNNTTTNDGPRVTVTVTGHSIRLIPFASFGITETATGRIEQFQVDK